MKLLENHIPQIDRKEQFKDFAGNEGRKKVTIPPKYLKKNDRRIYLREVLLEDHKFRIQNKPEGAQEKFDKLSESIFNFFRGTTLLYFRDYAGMDLHLPVVFTVGDMHPENFGVMPNENGTPFFGVNDFDEAYFAPFSYDIKRGSTGFYLIAKHINGLKKKKAKKIVSSFVTGYIDALIAFSNDNVARDFQFRIDNSPPLIKDLLQNVQSSRAHFLAEKVDMENEKFLATEEIVPFTKEKEKFEKAIKEYVKTNKISETEENFYEIKDVAIKKGSGTASMGLDRYWILINGSTRRPQDNIILELKQTRKSALDGLVPLEHTEKMTEENQAKQAVKAQQVHLAAGDPFYGYTSIDGKNYLIRERSPYKEKMDTSKLDYKELKEYARICGKALAQTHARSEKVSAGKENGKKNQKDEGKDGVEKILSSVNPELFTFDVARFAVDAVKRVRKDHKLFRKEHKRNVFKFQY